MKIRPYVGGDSRGLLELWNSAHPSTPLTPERMAKLIFLDCNFSPEDLLVAIGDGDRGPIGMAYCPHRYFAVGKDGDRDEKKGFITYFAVAGDCFDEVGRDAAFSLRGTPQKRREELPHDRLQSALSHAGV